MFDYVLSAQILGNSIDDHSSVIICLLLGIILGPDLDQRVLDPGFPQVTLDHLSLSFGSGGDFDKRSSASHIRGAQ